MNTFPQIAARLLRATACAVILAMPAACATASRGDFCQVYKPVYTVAADSEKTKSQVDGNNAVWLELCGEEEEHEP